ncbi:LmeA family phospholipid-binding protein [Nocardia sp. CNY236]|uniref:LmeA family phospholipid-binding protein n=1 Tax=Nocardia sp. CNY236 TaxID=1169152 RepID=UPI00048EE6ED|nr:LmeA family phospholipid-binding protein [Nocardia sp. CNY236]
MRKLIIGLLCLAGVAVVIDFSTAAYSEYRVSRALRHGADLTADPEVTIHGFPFLAQARDGRYDKIEIRARVRRPDIPGEIALGATLTEVRLPGGELVDGSLRGVRAARVDSSLRIEPIELGRLFGIPDLQVHLRPTDESDETDGSEDSGTTTTEALVLSGTLPDSPGVPYGGQRVNVQADLLLDGDRVMIVATDFHRGDLSSLEAIPVTAVVEADRPAVLAQFTRTIDTKELPFGVPPTAASARGGHIIVEGKGVNVTIDLDRLQQP